MHELQGCKEQDIAAPRVLDFQGCSHNTRTSPESLQGCIKLENQLGDRQTTGEGANSSASPKQLNCMADSETSSLAHSPR